MWFGLDIGNRFAGLFALVHRDDERAETGIDLVEFLERERMRLARMASRTNSEITRTE